ncbi:MAG TPA: LegC family aminotransferase [Tepidisphaeraceae bacterium]|jgi:perosamine synthetase|nr:LegC family aminotransferase [Tepidisphaeraceae bacterium]
MANAAAELATRVVEAVGRATGNAPPPLLLHQPTFAGNEWQYVKQCIDTRWVSSAGSFVTQFEQELAKFTGAAHAVAVVNGTAALHVTLLLCGVDSQSEVLIPSLTFVATANAVSYCGAIPHLCDVSRATLGLDPQKLAEHLDDLAELRGEVCFNKQTDRRIAAVVPMHTFGHCVDLDGLIKVADRWRIPLIEDAAESLGSYYHGRHSGTFGRMGVLSFNGNKTITTGAGGAILTNDASLATHAKHLTTTAKQPHAWEFVHDEIGYNYRMPNICAALGCAQLEQLPALLDQKRRLARAYMDSFAEIGGISIMPEPAGSRSNYWLNTLVLDAPDMEMRDRLLKALNDAGFQSRPIWRPMHQLPMYKECPKMDLSTTEALAAALINVPSSASLAPGSR